jgi:trehalose 6-phosphate synthase/phosphatase
MSGRIIVVSNRLPITLKLGAEGVEVRTSSGGLASGLSSVHASGKSLWIGWPGVNTEPGAERERIDQAMPEGTLAVHFTEAEMERFYDGVANGVLWPLFHYLLERVPKDIRDWDSYEEANRRFADAVADVAQPDDVIWIQDYQLMRVPALLRERLPRARIGFFLHIPFPSSEVFRILPQRETVLRGLLGADLVGFHTFNDQRHFSASLLSVLGFESEVDHVDVEGRSVRTGVFPMGIDAHAFGDRAREASVIEASRALRAAHGAEKLVLGVDRLDYTKGITRKFLAVERLLERSPRFRNKFRLVQVAVPSRETVGAYRELKREIEEIAGRVNGAQATLHSAPIHYVYDSVDRDSLVASYAAADVMLVTPLRDGMNLVAKEYVASRVDGDGVLVLSEFAGAATELAEALVVNPYDIAGIATNLERALDMPESERRKRMKRLRETVERRPVELWAGSFLETLGPAAEQEVRGPSNLGHNTANLVQLAERMAAEPKLVFLLDFDGTLVSIQRRPEDVATDREVGDLLRELTELPDVRVAVLSGRTRESLEELLGSVPIALVAEHGVWTRPWGAATWTTHIDPEKHGYTNHVREMLEAYSARTPGSSVESKSIGLAWHYRNVESQLGATRAREIRLNLTQILAQQPATVIGGRKVVEVRPQEADKGTAARQLLEGAPPDERIVAMGDDRTDEDLFRMASDSPYTFNASWLPTHAHFRIGGPEAVRELLARFVTARRARAANETHAPPEGPSP